MLKRRKGEERMYLSTLDVGDINYLGKSVKDKEIRSKNNKNVQKQQYSIEGKQKAEKEQNMLKHYTIYLPARIGSLG